MADQFVSCNHTTSRHSWTSEECPLCDDSGMRPVDAAERYERNAPLSSVPLTDEELREVAARVLAKMDGVSLDLATDRVRRLASGELPLDAVDWLVVAALDSAALSLQVAHLRAGLERITAKGCEYVPPGDPDCIDVRQRAPHLDWEAKDPMCAPCIAKAALSASPSAALDEVRALMRAAESAADECYRTNPRGGHPGIRVALAPVRARFGGGR